MGDWMVLPRLRGVAACLLGLVLSYASGAPGYAQSVGQSNAASQVIQGDVLNIEGETYTIKDKSGHEVIVRVTKETKQEDRIKVGDRIEAQLGSNGHATSIRVQLP